MFSCVQNFEVLASPLVLRVSTACGLHSTGVLRLKPDTRATPFFPKLHRSFLVTQNDKRCISCSHSPDFYEPRRSLGIISPGEAIILPIISRNQASRYFSCLLIKGDPPPHEVSIIWKNIFLFLLLLFLLLPLPPSYFFFFFVFQ